MSIIRELSAAAITDAVEQLCIEANTQLPADVKAALDKAEAAEPWPLAKETLGLLKKNLCTAKEKHLPICQDTCMACLFVEQGHDEKLEMEFFGGQTAFVIQDAGQAKIMISQMKVNDEQGTFSANAEIFADGKHFATTNLTGKFYVLGEAFVPAKEIAKGEEIAEDMLELVSVRLNRIKDREVGWYGGQKKFEVRAFDK